MTGVVNTMVVTISPNSLYLNLSDIHMIVFIPQMGKHVVQQALMYGKGTITKIVDYSALPVQSNNAVRFLVGNKLYTMPVNLKKALFRKIPSNLVQSKVYSNNIEFLR